MSKVVSFFFVSILLFTGWPGGARAQQDDLHRTIITPPNHAVSISNLGAGVNSTDDDFAPMVLGNGRVLYFTSNRTGDQDIYSTAASRTGWGPVIPAREGINSSEPDGSTTITPDGHFMVFVGCDRDDGFGDCDLYAARYSAGAWRDIRNLGRVINSEHWESQPSISADGTRLFFASDRPGGYGGTDIWVSQRTLGGTWSVPVNLGSTVNTAGDELAPYIAPDGVTLYFASDQHPGIGGLDIYVTRFRNGKWTSPENMGMPINTVNDESFFTVQLGTDNAYFASTRDGGQGNYDLFVAVPNPLPPDAVTTIVGVVKDAKTGQAVGAKLTVTDLSNQEKVAEFYSDDIDGNYVVVLSTGRSYAVTAEAPGYLFYSDRFDVSRNSRNRVLRRDILMDREMVRLLVFFDFDKAVLKPESRADLNQAVKWLKNNPGIQVEVAGHTDNVGSPDYNKKLSQQRANAVRQYLVDHGIAPSRIIARGYGMDEPIATNETEEGRAKNRRVEFRVKTR